MPGVYHRKNYRIVNGTEKQVDKNARAPITSSTYVIETQESAHIKNN